MKSKFKLNKLVEKNSIKNKKSNWPILKKIPSHLRKKRKSLELEWSHLNCMSQ
jgi:hypothetical protein